jgi:WD40 repeat protein
VPFLLSRSDFCHDTGRFRIYHGGDVEVEQTQGHRPFLSGVGKGVPSMSRANVPGDGRAADAPARLEEIVDRFEDAWRQGGRPAPEDYLPPDDSLRGAILRELVHVDLECRLKAGEDARAETYLERYPELGDDLGVAVDLILAEWELRCRRDGPVPFTDYARRLRRLRETWSARRPCPAGLPSTLPAGEGAGERTVSYPVPHLPTQPSPGSLPFPGYEVLEELGQGGMGVVYRARQVGLNRLVALKTIAPGREAGAEYLARFRREAESAARLQHPNIIQVYEVGEHDGRPFFSMEHADGGSLEKKVQGVPQPGREAAGLVEVLARAVQYAHQRGVLHRDLKPANVLLAADGTPKVADFGLAKQLDDDTGQTRTGMFLGTPSYMAPEQAASRIREFGPWTDVYALGAVLYELLTGRPPFRGATVMDTLDQVRSQEVVAPRRLQPKVPRDLETVCLKCLEKDPRRRYATAEDLADDLRRFLDGRPIKARPVGPLGRAGKWARRQPIVAVLSALVVVVTLLGFGLVTWQWREASAALAETVRAHETKDEALRDASAATEQARQAQHDADKEQRRAATAAGQAARAEADARRYRTEAEVARGEAAEEARKAQVQKGLAEAAGEKRAVLDYCGHITNAQREWGRDNLGRAGALLDECTDESLRGWEWHYLRRLCQGGLRTLYGHRGEVTALAFSPDGSLLASASGDRTVRVWETATGREVYVLAGHTDRVSSVAFSRDGRLASGSWDGTARFWDVKTGKPLGDVMRHDCPVFCVRFTPGKSPPGRQLLVTAGGKYNGDKRGPEGELKYWDDAGRPFSTSVPDLPPVSWVGYSADSRFIALAPHQLAPDGPGWVGTVEVAWGRNLEQLTPLGKQPGLLTGMALSPDGRLLASASLTGAAFPLLPSPPPSTAQTPAAAPPDVRESEETPPGEAKLWDVEQGKFLRPLPGYGAVDFSPDGRVLALAGRHQTVLVWDVAREQDLNHLRGHLANVTALAFSPDGHWLASGSADATIKLWSVTSGPDYLTLPGPGGTGTAVAFDADSRVLAGASAGTGGVDVRTWVLPAGREGTRLHDPASPVSLVAFAPGGKRLATVGSDGAVELWDATTGEKLRSPGKVAAPATSLTFTPDGRRLVLMALPEGGGGMAKGPFVEPREPVNPSPLPGPAGETPKGPSPMKPAPAEPAGPPGRMEERKGEAWVWDLSGDREPFRVTDLAAAALHLDTGRLATAGSGAVRLWDIATGAGLHSLDGLPGRAVVTAFSRDGRRLAAADAGGTVLVWDTGTGKPVHTLRGPEAAVTALAFAADGTRLASGDRAGTVRVWDLATDPPLRELAGRRDAVTRLTFSPDPKSRCLISAGGDGVVQLWDTAANDPLQTLQGHPDSARTVTFIPDGRRVAAASWGGTVKVWDAGTGEEVLSLEGPAERVVAVAFSPDGRWLTAVREGGTVTAWDARPPDGPPPERVYPPAERMPRPPAAAATQGKTQ